MLGLEGDDEDRHLRSLEHGLGSGDRFLVESKAGERDRR
jgi:hypothetical protein